MSDQRYHRVEAASVIRGHSWTEIEHLAAIHDEQQIQTGLLADLRGAIDDLAEALAPQGDPCPCGCRRDVEPTEQEGGFDNERIPADPEPEPVESRCEEFGHAWHSAVNDATEECHWCGTVRRKVTNAPPEAPGAHESDDQAQETHEGSEAATGRTGTNLALAERVARAIFEEHNKSGLDFDGYPRAISLCAARAVLDSLTPADFGWTVLGEGQVAVDRVDLNTSVGVIDALRPFHDPANERWFRRLRDALDGDQP